MSSTREEVTTGAGRTETNLGRIRVDQSGYPPLWLRVLAYVFALQLMGYAVLMASRYHPILVAYQNKDALSIPASWLLAFLQRTYVELVGLGTWVALIGMSELAVAFFRRRHHGQRWAWLCVVAVALLGFASVLFVIYTISSVQFRMQPVIGFFF